MVTTLLKRQVKRLLPPSTVDAWQRRQEENALSPIGRSIVKRDRELGVAGLIALPDPGPDAVVRASLDWLLAAQAGSRSKDGGVARDYDLRSGWSASYPETTGYIIPTLLEAAKVRHDARFARAARRMLDWLVRIQLPDGGFQGGRIDQTPVMPVTFNTGQILIGLAAGVRYFNDPAILQAMHKAARFLRDSQDTDGCWRSHPTPFAGPGDKAYETHVSWGLFEADRVAPGEGYGEAGLKQVRWAISRQRANGWFDDNCLTQPSSPLTHTIGYVLRGIIEAHRWQAHPDLIASARRCADGLLPAISGQGYLAGRLNANWQPAANYACLTGSAQIASCYFLLHEIEANPAYLSAGRRLNGFVRRTVALDGAADYRGGVRGSWPVDGGYGRYQFLNWAAKFTIDAQLHELAAVQNAKAD